MSTHRSDDKEDTVRAAAVRSTLKPPNDGPAGRDDPQARLAKLFEQHHGPMFAAAYRITGNAHDAEDVLQTVFLRLAQKNGPSLEPSPGAYLRRAAVNAALDIMRSPRRRAVDLEDVGPVLADTSQSPSDAQRSKEIRESLRQGLTKLSPKAAEMFVLRYLEGYENDEIAKLVGSTRGSVAVMLHRARHQLKGTFRDFVAGEEK